MNIFGEIGQLFNYVFMQPIYNGLMLLYFLFKDYGLAIIVLTVIIKLLLFPLTLKQLKSMKANQQLQPRMQEIRKKYGKDSQRQAQEMQELYREFGINPLSGCLPLLVQLPVLYGLYYALSNVLRDLPHYKTWIYAFLQPLFLHPPDVSFKWFAWISPTLTFPLSQPDPSHVLPVIAALATFVQISMSQPKKPADAPKSDTPDPSASTMKIMRYIMPAMTLIFALQFPAGLALYWTVSSIFQAVQQYFVTGWGALLVKPPELKPKSAGAAKSSGAVVESTARVVNSNGTTSGTKKQTEEIDESAEDEEQTDGDSGAIASKLGSTTASRSGNRPSTSSPSHRSRNNSASARRRGGAQRSRR